MPGPGGLPSWVQERADGVGLGVYAAAVCGLALAAAGLVGMLLQQPWIFPSLGPTLMLLAERARQEASRPRNIVVGHAVAVAAGALALLVTGLTEAPPVTQSGLDVARIAAAALSLSVTAFVLAALRISQPPAGATTLIVSLGILTSAVDLAVIMASVVLTSAVAVLVNLLAGARQRGVRAPAG